MWEDCLNYKLHNSSESFVSYQVIIAYRKACTIKDQEIYDNIIA